MVYVAYSTMLTSNPGHSMLQTELDLGPYLHRGIDRLSRRSALASKPRIRK